MTVRENVERARQATDTRYQEPYRALNDGQRQAVDAIEGPVMVLAGPGTGKTQVLAMRIAAILQRTQMDPWNILCLTFTESATTAMRERLISIVGEAAYSVRINTFHSFCNEVISEHPETFALNREWRVLAEVERLELLRELLDELPGTSALKPFGNPYLFLPDIVQAVQWLKKEGVDVDRLRALLKETRLFLSASHDIVDKFVAMKAHERSDADCERVQRELERLQSRHSFSEGLWQSFAHVLERYADSRSAADGKREAGKARTQLKNDLKKLADKMTKQLPRQQDLLEVYGWYQERLIERGRYDYEDMIMHVKSAFGENEELLAQYQEQFQYVLVDEYQDTNGAQNEVVRLLGSFDASPNVFVVGDDKQSIFRFQGASLENLLSFYGQYRDTVQVLSLTDNYRSQQVILDAAGAVIERNTESVQAYLPEVADSLISRAALPEAPLELREFDTEDEENFFVADAARSLIAGGAAPDEIAVLYRFNRDAAGLLDMMLRLDVPVRLEAGQNVLDDRRVQQILSLLTYLQDEQADEALADVLQFDWMGLAPLDALKVIHYAGRRRLPLLHVVSQGDVLAEAGVANTEAWLEFADKLAQWRVVMRNTTLQAAFDEIVQESGFLQSILDGDETLATLQHVTTLFNELKRLNESDSRMTFKDFIGRLDLLQENGLPLTADPWQTQAQAVRLMTAHRAKGLEFEHVFVTGLVDRHWGNLRERARVSLPQGILAHDPIADQQNNEDERRLFYVALTRAKKRAYLSYARADSGGREHVPSLFVREIPDEHVVSVPTLESENKALKRLQTLRLATVEKAGGDDVRAWLQEVLSQYVMSVTHLNNYLECPKLFYYRNLLRVPAGKTKHMSFGTAIHAALRDMFSQINEGKAPTSNYLYQRFAWHLKRETLTDVERDDSLAVGREVLREYYAERRQSFAPRTLLEYSFRGHGVHMDDVRLTGQLDKIEFIDTTQVNVVDYKTGNPDNAYGRAKPGGAYHRQLVFYKLLCDSSPRFEYEMVSGELDFIQKSPRRGKHVGTKYEISGDEAAELTETVRRVWGEMRELKFLNETEWCGKCEYCKG